MAYPEDDGGDVGMAPSLGGGSLTSKLKNFEGLIPLILIGLIVVVGASMLGFVDLPFISKQGPVNMLVIGSPSIQTQEILDEDRDLVVYTIRPAQSLTANPGEALGEYDVVMLDQSAQFDKTIPRVLGEALQNYVTKGGKLIVVANSGIARVGAPDVIGWKASLGDVVPVECTRLPNGTPSCQQSVFVRGEIWRQDFDHPIMRGIELVPALPELPLLELETFEVSETGNTVAFIKSADTPQWYPAIVEKRLVLGKSVYFNYNPGLTRGIFEATLAYLR